jgi:hypothetical protein
MNHPAKPGRLTEAASNPVHESGPDAAVDPQSEPGPRDIPREIGGRGGLDPTRYGDWEKNGRWIDF